MGTIPKIRFAGKTKLRNNCKEVMLLPYIEMCDTQDFSYLVISGSKKDTELLSKQFEKISNEFAELRGKDIKSYNFDVVSYKQELALKIQYGAVLAEQLFKGVSLKLVAPEVFEGLVWELEQWGYYINREIPLIDVLGNIENEITALESTIEALNEEIYPEAEKVEAEVKNTVMELHTTLLLYGKILGLGDIKPEEVSLVKFAAMEKQVEKLNKPKSDNQ